MLVILVILFKIELYARINIFNYVSNLQFPKRK